VCDWHTREEYLAHSIDVLGRLAHHYRGRHCLYGIEVLNEPRWDVPTALLHEYYRRAYRAIREHCPPDDVAVVFHDGFRSYREHSALLHEAELRNVILDVHRYQCFERADLDLDMDGHLHKAAVTWKDEAREIQHDTGVSAVVGEWSLGLDLEVVSLWAEGPFDHALQGMAGPDRDVAYRDYGLAQLRAFEQYLGWFFWSYRTETTPDWCFRECIERGWLALPAD
jgi:glucan 1,3-beta-glucosidase